MEPPASIFTGLDLGIKVTDIVNAIGPVMAQVWPIIALIGGFSVAFWVAGYIKRFARPSRGA